MYGTDENYSIHMKILAPFLLLTLLTCKLKPEGCLNLKNGTFQLLSEDGTTHIITRSEGTQSENVVELGLVSEYDILWSDNCEYKLFNRRVVLGTDRFPDMKIDTLYCEIIEIDGNVHTTETSIKDSDFAVIADLKSIE